MKAHVDGPKHFPHVIRGDHIRYPGQSVQQAIFKAEDRCRADNGCFWKNVPYDFFGTGLQQSMSERAHVIEFG